MEQRLKRDLHIFLPNNFTLAILIKRAAKPVIAVEKKLIHIFSKFGTIIFEEENIIYFAVTKIKRRGEYESRNIMGIIF